MYASNLTVPIHAWPPVRPGLAHGPQAAFPIPGAAAAVSARAPALPCSGILALLHFYILWNEATISKRACPVTVCGRALHKQKVPKKGLQTAGKGILNTLWSELPNKPTESGLQKAVQKLFYAQSQLTGMQLGKWPLLSEDTISKEKPPSKSCFSKCKTCEGIFFF